MSRPDLLLAEGALSDFVGWLNERLDELSEAAATPESVGQLTTTTGQYGFVAAGYECAAQYEAARASFQDFVRAQRDSIELLGHAAQLIERDFVATDAEQVDCLRQIMADFESLYATPPPTREVRP